MKYTENYQTSFHDHNYPSALVHLIPYFKKWCFLDPEDVYKYAKTESSENIISFVRQMNASQNDVEQFIALGNGKIPIPDEYVIVDLTFTASDALDAKAMLLETKDEIGDFRDRFRK